MVTYLKSLKKLHRLSLCSFFWLNKKMPCQKYDKADKNVYLKQ
ncbi:hypothetical protein M23134_06746 [Microscilla marina ATCC 23134]|uniref:Uncharacterized protein n=1 Tax=Microscilla marina ATCC 23134 TaxID=313606 RepID=A1ZXS6_MICM2|nr:hypothetical protein M23134_06746 [Microscilla marina ATCC 23134]